MTERDWDTIQDRQTIPWASFSLDEFVTFYEKVTAPALEAAEYDPDSIHSAGIYRELGFGRYMEAIRRHHDCTFKTFLTEVVGLVEEESPHEYNWPIDDIETKYWLDEFVKDLRERDATKSKESTVQRVAMNTYVFLHEWQEAHGSTNIIETLENATNEEAYELVLDVYDRLNNRDITENTKKRYVTDHGFFFEFLSHPTNPLDYNPIEDVKDRFNWRRKEVNVLERSALSPSQVKQLWNHTESVEERMLLVAACAWGLRAGEIASLHIDQLVLDPDPDEDFTGPVVDFGERKQGPSTVNIVYGRNVAEDRINQLKDEYGDDWNGYLFPSSDHRTEHLRGRSLLTRRFQPIAERAGVTVDGDKPNLKQARRFWYQRYWAGQQRFHELVTLAAEEQGSKDPQVVESNYLGDLSRLEFSRLWVRRELEAALDMPDIAKEPIYLDESILASVREALVDFLTFVENVLESEDSSGPSSLPDEDGRLPVHGMMATLVFLTVLATAIVLF